MTVMPTWEQFMVPCLHVLSDGRARPSRETIAEVADRERLSEEARAVTTTSGYVQHVNRISWALSYLYRAGAVQRPSRGVYVITDVGRELLVAHPGGLTEKALRTVPGYRTPRSSAAPQVAMPVVEDVELDPVEQIEAGIARVHEDVAAELLVRLHGQDPAFFEQAVLDLLMAMGYGGVDGTATGTQLSNDGGIDGIIDQDALGLNRVYVQAKRYALDSAVGRPEIQGFVGALQGRQTNQGVFITTGRFSRGAQEYAEAVATRLILIDGDRLAALMIRYGVGVQVKQTHHVVEVDEDFFS